MALEKRAEPEIRHSLDARRQVYVPVVIALFLVLFVLVVIFVLSVSGEISSQQVQVIAGIMMTLFILLPMAVMLMALAALMLFVALGSGDLYSFLVPPLRTVRDYTEQSVKLSREYAWRVSDPIISARARTASAQEFVSRLIGIPEEKEKP